MSTQVSKTKKSLDVSQYRGLLFLVVAFLVLTVAMLVSNFIATQYFTKQSQITKLATQQGVFVQQMSKNLMDVDLYLHQKSQLNDVQAASGTVALEKLPQDAIYRIHEIQGLRDKFEHSLFALEHGGTIDGLGVTAVSGQAKQHVERIRQIWNPYLGLIDNFIQDTQKNKISFKTSSYLVDYTRLYNQTLLSETQTLSEQINAKVLYQADVWKVVQVLAVVVAFVLFAWIVFGALRQLAQRDKLLASANREMKQIMTSTREGLFLLNKDFVIAGEYSANLENLLGMKNLGGTNFLELAKTLLPESEIETLQIFVEQLYSEWVMEDLIDDLNPLHRIEITQENQKTKYLDFKFFRVMNQKQIEGVLVSVVDSTQAVLLKASLEAQQEQERREMELLNTILNTEPVVLRGFINISKQRLEEINNRLKAQNNTQAELHDKVSSIGRSIHGIKGESSSLRLHRMVDICEKVEDSLANLRRMTTLTGQDFLGLVVLVEDLYRLTDILDNYSQRMNNNVKDTVMRDMLLEVEETTKQFSGSLNQEMQARVNHLQKFVQDIAQREGKQAQLMVEGFDEMNWDAAQWQPIQDILVQILRNAVVHGIESPDLRQVRRKPALGTLKLTFSEQADGYYLIAEDDGNGIDFDAIRLKAVALGMATAEEAAQFDYNQLMAVMMSDGFSTLNHVSEDAGKGVGMGIITDSVHQMGGKMNVSSASEEYTRFTFLFPK